MRLSYLVAVGLALSPVAALASETINYTYDAKGRLVQAKHAGSVNNGVVTTYALDAADNRTNVTVTGSLFDQPPLNLIVVPLNGLTLIAVP